VSEQERGNQLTVTSRALAPRDGRDLLLPRRRPNWAARIYGLVVLGLAGALGIVYYVKTRQIERLEQEAAAASALYQQKQRELTLAGQAALKAQGGELLTLSALPLSWAVRTELLARDFREVGNYFRQFVLEPKVRRVVLVTPDGKVRISSDQKLEGKDAAAVLPGVPLDVEAPQVMKLQGEVLVLVPVMGLNSRLGLVVVSYAPEVFGAS